MGVGDGTNFFTSDHGVVPELPEPWSPVIIKAWSPNHGGIRTRTDGCVIHSTRGNASSWQNEFNGTLNWFKSPASQVSAHIVIAADGTVATCVDDALVAWHAGEHNTDMLGVEICQSRLGEQITGAQYRSLAWWLRRMSAKYGFLLTLNHLPEHKDTAQGKRVGKSDVGNPYSFLVLKQYL